jgi:RNA polymerase sigma-70 factor (ECF subfamily)
MAAPDDATLVEKARTGDKQAFGELVSRHEGAMFAIARSYFASEADVEDAVQEAFVKAYQRLSQLEAGSRFAGWLARITANTCIDTLRSKSEKVSLEQFATTVQLHPRLGQIQFTPATLASRGERSDMVRAAVGRLPEDLRVVVMLYFGEGMTYDQIADYLDTTFSTVQGRLNRAKQALKKVLKGLRSPQL